MGKIKDVLLSPKGLYILAGLIVIMILIRIIKIVIKKNSVKKELRQAASDRARDEKLNEFILNSHDSSQKNAFVPYDVDYSKATESGDTQKSVIKSEAFMVQVVENTQLSTRKFALNATNGIKIGTTANNDVTFISDDSIDYQCEIIAVGKNVFVRDLLGGSRLILARKKNQAIIDTKGLKIQSGDTVVMGNHAYTITFVK